MSEIAFAKSILAALDSRHSKLSLDHVEDPRTYPARSPYILPKPPRPMSKRQKVAPGHEKSLEVTLRSLRNPPLDITLKSQSPLLSILAIKNEISTQTSLPVDKLRILHNRKPVGDAKVLKDLAGEQDEQLELSVMVLGGAAALVTAQRDQEDSRPGAAGIRGQDVLQTTDFWDDLKAFLMQRLKDEEEGQKVFDVFRKAWEGTS